MPTNTRFGVGGSMCSSNNYATNTISLYDFWHVYHPKEWASLLAPHGIQPLVRKRQRPLILEKDETGQITAILCRNGWILHRTATGKQTKNLMQRPYGDGMVFPCVDHRSPEADRWLTDHGYIHAWEPRQWCATHRVLHGHVNFASPTFHKDCFYTRHPEFEQHQFRSIPQHTFRCATCGKHKATVRKERQKVWSQAMDSGTRAGFFGTAKWDNARTVERSWTCCGFIAEQEEAA